MNLTHTLRGALLFGLFLIAGNAYAFPGSGDGTAGDPYQITDPESLDAVRDYDGSGVYFKLMNDIDLDVAPYNTGEGWEPLPTLQGTFDGDGHAISNLYMDTSSDSGTGLFSGNQGTIVSVLIRNADVSGGMTTGILAGWSSGLIATSSVTGTVSGGTYTGGLIGENSVTGIISGCYADVVVTGNSGAEVLGALSGNNYAGARIMNSYARGSVSTDSTHIGGLTGSSYLSFIENSYSAATVSGPAGLNTGGLVGTNEGTSVSSYWDIETSGQEESRGGTGTTTLAMKRQSTFEGWDFDTIWNIDPDVNDGYPFLRPYVAPEEGGGEEDPEFAGGTGVDGDPYRIDACAQLSLISVDEASLDAQYLLMENLDCTSIGNDVMISGELPFTGTFDGDDHSITIALSIEGEDYIGLFRRIIGGTVRDLSVAGTIEAAGSSDVGMLAGQVAEGAQISGITVAADIEGFSESGDIDRYGGAFGSFSTSTMSGVTVSGTVSAEGDHVGGVAGRLQCQASVSGSSSSATVSGIYRVGGFAGRDDCEGPGSVISDSFATGDVSGTEEVGGFVGSAGYVIYEDVYATGDVEGEYTAGGLIGTYYGAYAGMKLFHAYATGDVSGYDDIGGLIGYMEGGVVSQSYATGDVTASDEEYEGGDMGGLIAVIDDGSTVRDSFARGDVTNPLGTSGGFAGQAGESVLISGSYSTGHVGETEDGFGGFISDLDDEGLYVSFWDTETSGLDVGCGDDDSCGASGRATAQMKTASTFTDAGWDFEDMWELDGDVNDGYPYLLGGDDVEFEPGPEPEPEPSEKEGPVETILDENQFHGGGVAQGWHDDDDYWEYELPFTFTFYGEEYSTVYVSSNGYLGFDDANMDEYELDIVSGNGSPIIAAMGSDLVTGSENPEDDIYITDVGDGTVIFRWQAPDIDHQDALLTFEIVLHDDNTFEINYSDADSTFAEPVAVGVNDGMGSYVVSAYDGRTDFDQLNTSAWEWEEEESAAAPERSSRRSGGGSVTSRVKALDANGNQAAADALRAQYPNLFGDGSLAALRSLLASLQARLAALSGAASAGTVRDLDLAMTGEDVRKLQQLLIDTATGPAASALATNGATDHFGALTKAALAEYQAKHGIAPAAGYFGPATRAQMKAAGLAGVWW